MAAWSRLEMIVSFFVQGLLAAQNSSLLLSGSRLQNEWWHYRSLVDRLSWQNLCYKILGHTSIFSLINFTNLEMCYSYQNEKKRNVRVWQFSASNRFDSYLSKKVIKDTFSWCFKSKPSKRLWMLDQQTQGLILQTKSLPCLRNPAGVNGKMDSFNATPWLLARSRLTICTAQP